MELMHAIVRVKTRWIDEHEFNDNGELKDKAKSMGPDYTNFEAKADAYGVEIVDSGEVCDTIDEEWHWRDYMVELSTGGIENFAEFLVSVHKYGDQGV